jgi:hypothetical protein
MKITKHDVADICFVWIALSLLMYLLAAIMQFVTFLGMSGAAAPYANRAGMLATQGATVAVLLGLIYLVLLKRPAILRLVFPDAEDKIVDIPEGLTELVNYAFWVRLIGLFALIRTFVQFSSKFVAALAIRPEYTSGTRQMSATVASLASCAVALAVICNAEGIVRILRLEKRNEAETE